MITSRDRTMGSYPYTKYIRLVDEGREMYYQCDKGYLLQGVLCMALRTATCRLLCAFMITFILSLFFCSLLHAPARLARRLF